MPCARAVNSQQGVSSQLISSTFCRHGILSPWQSNSTSPEFTKGFRIVWPTARGNFNLLTSPLPTSVQAEVEVNITSCYKPQQMDQLHNNISVQLSGDQDKMFQRWSCLLLGFIAINCFVLSSGKLESSQLSTRNHTNRVGSALEMKINSTAILRKDSIDYFMFNHRLVSLVFTIYPRASVSDIDRCSEKSLTSAHTLQVFVVLFSQNVDTRQRNCDKLQMTSVTFLHIYVK